MGAAMVDERTILCYVEDRQAFDQSAAERFNALDADGDGMVSLDELRKGSEKSMALEDDATGQQEGEDPCNAVLERFDEDKDGRLSLAEFRSLYREMMLCLARGIGHVPLLVVVGEDSPLLKAIEHERTVCGFTVAKAAQRLYQDVSMCG